MELDRYFHAISPRHGDKRPDPILFLDCEANAHRPRDLVEVHTFRLAVAALCRYSEAEGLTVEEWQTFHASKDLWAWVSRLSVAHKDLMIVAHNMDYDGRLSDSFSLLPYAGFEPTYAIMAETCTLFVWKRAKHKVTLMDNMNLWQCTLEELGESVGLPKLNIDFDTATDAELETYCRRDVEILVKTWAEWLAFLDDHALGSFGITAAKQAFNAYQARFLSCKLCVHNNGTAMNLERRAYKGGRTECFRIGKLDKKTWYKLDVNGLYAAMMRWYPYPRVLLGVAQNVVPEYLDHLLEDRLAIADVILSTEKPMYPVRLGGRNAYPVGDFFATLTTPELKQALAGGDIVGVGRVAVYEPADLFSDYVDFWTEHRQRYKTEGNRARSEMCKLMRNSLQGKFGQRGYQQEIVGDAPIDEVNVELWAAPETGETWKEYTFGGKVIRQMQKGEWDHSSPAIPAHVAAYGRTYMWSLIQLAGREHVAYMDTDSLFVDHEGLTRLAGVIDDVELGMLKVEGVAQDVEIRAKKDYHFGKLDVKKGIRDDALEIEPGQFEQWHFTTLDYAFRSKELGGVVLNKVRKKLARGTVAGTIQADGWVRPPRLTIDRKQLWDVRNTSLGASRWVWELDEAWVERVTRPDGLGLLFGVPAGRGTGELEGEPPAPPEPLLDEAFGLGAGVT